MSLLETALRKPRIERDYFVSYASCCQYLAARRGAVPFHLLSAKCFHVDRRTATRWKDPNVDIFARLQMAQLRVRALASVSPKIRDRPELWHVRDLVHCWGPLAALLHRAICEEFNLTGRIGYDKRVGRETIPIRFPDLEPPAGTFGGARECVRAAYIATQERFPGAQFHLFRGVTVDYRVPPVVEFWSESRDIAVAYSGHDGQGVVREAMIPIERIIWRHCSRPPYEFLVLPDVPELKVHHG